MKLKVNKAKKMTWRKELRESKCQKLGVWTFSPKSVMMVEGSKAHHLNMIVYLGKILIRDYLGE